MPRSLDGFVFHTVRGRAFSKPTLWYVWRPIAAAWRAAGHEDLDLYELRHAAATMLLERGVSHADVAVQLGHTDGGALVMERYGHPSEDLSRERLKMAWVGHDRSAGVPERGRQSCPVGR
jgi:integrase